MKNRYIQPSIVVIMAFLSITLLPFGKNTAEADVSKKAYNDVCPIDSIVFDSVVEYQPFICYATSKNETNYIIVRRLLVEYKGEIKNYLIGIEPDNMKISVLETHIIHSANITWADVERKFRNTTFMTKWRKYDKNVKKSRQSLDLELKTLISRGKYILPEALYELTEI